MIKEDSAKWILPWFVWLFGALFFLFDYIIRVSPSVLTPTLMAEFQTNAFAIGGFSGFFYYAYISMQIPVGILVDRFGPKRLLVFSSAICAISTFMFASMHSLEVGYLSRLMMGFGASFALVGTWKLTSLWFNAKRFAMLAGTAQAMGMVGAMIGQGPMASLYMTFGWRASMYAMAVLLLLLCGFFIFVVKDFNPYIQHSDINIHEKIKILPSLKTVMQNPQTWYNCLFVGVLYAPSACFGEQWGASFLASSQNISINQAGDATGILFIGLAIGCPILGFISDRLKRRLLVMRVCIIACLILLLTVIYGSRLPFASILNIRTDTVLLFIYGFFNAGIVISYAMAAELNPRQLTGIGMSVANMASVIVGAVMIPIVGFVLDHLWSGQMLNGARVFSVQDYQTAFIALPIMFVIGFIITFFQKETFCQFQVK